MTRFVVQNFIYPYVFCMGLLFLQQPYSNGSNYDKNSNSGLTEELVWIQELLTIC